MSFPSPTYHSGPVTPQTASGHWTPRPSGPGIPATRTLLSPRPANAQPEPTPERAPQVNAQVVLAASVGNPQASTHILRSYHESVSEFLWGMVAAELGAPSIDDLCQETFARFFIALRNEADPLARPIRPWLIDIANAVASERIRQVRQENLQQDSTHRPRPANVEPWDLYSAAMQSLSTAHREILFLRQDQGLTYIEIARTLGVCVGTVKSRLSRSRKALDRTMRQLSR